MPPSLTLLVNICNFPLVDPKGPISANLTKATSATIECQKRDPLFLQHEQTPVSVSGNHQDELSRKYHWTEKFLHTSFGNNFDVKQLHYIFNN